MDDRIKIIDELLKDPNLSSEHRTKLEKIKSKIINHQIQQRKLEDEEENIDDSLMKENEEIKLEKKYKEKKKEVERLEEINKVSLTDHEINFRRAMMKEDGSGLIQRLFACIEKDPRYATSPEYLAAKKEIEEAFKNPFDMKEFAKKQEEYIATREKYRELIAKDPYNHEEISQISNKLKILRESIVTEANKYLFNKKKLETLYEKNIKSIARLGSYATTDERNAIINEIQKVYEPFHDRFDSERMLKSYTQDLAKIEAQMAELEVKKSESKEGFAATATPASSAEPETISKTATQGTPVTPASSVGTATNPTGTNPEKDSETKDHSGLHFIGLPNDKYYDSVRDAYRYGDEIEIDKEEEIDGTTFITLKGSDVKIKKSLFATTADIEDEFKDAMKAHKTSTNHIKAGMKVTPCWPGHYNRAILKNGARGNTADIEVKNMKLHDEIEVEKVFYRGTRKFVKLVGYENAFSADSFAIAPSTIKEIAEKKAAAKKDKEELKAKKSKTGPENAAENEAENTAANDPLFEGKVKETYQETFDKILNGEKDVTAPEETPDKQNEQQTPENEQQAQINEINETDPKLDPESIIQEVKSYSPSNASGNEQDVEEQSVLDSLDKANNIDPKNEKEHQATFDNEDEQKPVKQPVTNIEKPNDEEKTKARIRKATLKNIVKSENLSFKHRLAAGWLIMFSKSDDMVPNLENYFDRANLNEEEEKELEYLIAEVKNQRGEQITGSTKRLGGTNGDMV